MVSFRPLSRVSLVADGLSLKKNKPTSSEVDFDSWVIFHNFSMTQVASVALQVYKKAFEGRTFSKDVSLFRKYLLYSSP